jgi:hypothetical protein
MKRRSTTAVELAASLVALVLLRPADVRADDPRLGVDLFQSARQLMNEGKFERACPLLADSQKADPQPGTQLNLAVCYEKIGKTASAWSVYSDLTQSGGPLQKQAASAAIERLQLKLSRLKVDVCERPNFDVARLTITRNGQELGQSSLGRPSPVDAGEYRIDASVPGFEKWSGSVRVAADGDLQSVELCLLQPEPRVTPVTAPTGSDKSRSSKPAASESDTAPAVKPAPKGSGWVYATASVALGAAIFGGTFVVVAASQKSHAQGFCPDKRCDEAGWQKLDSAKRSADIATVALAVAGVAGAATLYFALRSPGEEPTRALIKAPRIGLRTRPNGGELSLGGAF